MHQSPIILVNAMDQVNSNTYLVSPMCRAFWVSQTVKNLPAMQETHVRSLGWEDSLEKGMATQGNGSPLQYSCLENPTDRGAWQARVHVVTKSRT